MNSLQCFDTAGPRQKQHPASKKNPTLIILKLSLFGSSRTSKGYINNHQVCASVALETKIQLYVRSHKTFRESEKDLHRYFNFQNVCINMFR